jgi:fermentation-respiration switch protein FrsA (DUF1100 family)
MAKIKSLFKIAAATTAAVGGIGYLVFHEVFARNAVVPQLVSEKVQADMQDPNAPAEEDPRLTWFNQQEFEEFNITNRRGQNLRAYLIKAEQPSNVYVFCSHGYRNCGKGEFNYIAKFHHDAGRNVFMVDHVASGESDGKYVGFGYFESNDCMEWLDFMLKNFGDDIQIILHGVSMGSATITLMCGDVKLPDNVKFAIADCGYTSVQAQFESVLKNAHVPTFPIIPVAEFFNKKLNVFAFADVSPLSAVQKAKIPMLFIHGKTDDFVPAYMGVQLYHACSSEDKELLLVDGAWHAESYRKNSEEYEKKVNAFADKYIK